MKQDAIVADIMRREVEFIAAEATVQEAAQLMGELDVSALAVGSREALEGLITDRDILLRIVAMGMSVGEARVRNAMTSVLFSCREDDSLQTALDVMAAHDVRRLPVVGANGAVVGWVTLIQVWERLLRDGLIAPAKLEAVAGASQ